MHISYATITNFSQKIFVFTVIQNRVSFLVAVDV